MNRRLQFAVFFSIVIALYSVLNSYIFIRGWEVASTIPGLRLWYTIVYLILAFSFLAGRFLERVSLNWFSHALVWIGSFWLAEFAYLYLTLLAIDILRLANHLIPLFPAWIMTHAVEAKQLTALAVLGSTIAVIIAGHINAIRPRVRKLEITIPKNGRTLKSVDIVAASDIHLGTVIGRSRLEKIVAKINALAPDIVLFPGDVFDEDIGSVIKQNLGETLRTIKAPYGVYSCTGNHEYIGGVEPAVKYLTDHGITVLRDTAVRIADSFTLAGREDLAMKQFDGTRRKPLPEVLANVDKNLPLILLDHQPMRLDEAVENGVDLQLSGHTHHGQIWPFSYITKKMYEVSWGYKKKGNTHFYVSSGVGTWGPPVRTGNTPEIVQINLNFA